MSLSQCNVCVLGFFLFYFRQQVKGRMVKVCAQDKVKESQEKEDEKDGAGAVAEDHSLQGRLVQR